MSVAGIILAAGNSERMGRPKALLPLGAKTFLQHALEALSAAGVDDVFVVCGRDARRIRGRHLVHPNRIVENPDPGQGQLSSLKIGLAAAREENATAAVAWLIDHPSVSPTTLKVLLESLDGDTDFVRPRYNGKNGHPLVISRRIFDRIADMPLDKGLKPLFSSSEVTVKTVEVVDANVVQDIDTPEEYQRLIDDEQS